MRSLDTPVEARRPLPPIPAKLPAPMPRSVSDNATVVEAFTLWYGLAGRTDVPVGRRCRLTDIEPSIDLCRYHDDVTNGALCSLSHFALDDDVVLTEGYRP